MKKNRQEHKEITECVESGKREREREIRNVESRMSQPLLCVCVCSAVYLSAVKCITVQ